MIIKTLTFDDFLIFHGRQSLELNEGLYVIHGENGRGKSTFLHGISWALLGRFDDRQGNPVPDSVLINHDSRKAGKTEAQVEMKIEIDGTESIIRRTYDSESDSTRLYVQKAAKTLDQDSAEMFLRGILDRDVARFFLFDGEDLRRYEEMLGEGGAADVRKSVEHILGLPALTNAASDLNAVGAELRTKATRAASKEGKAAQAVLQAEQARSALEDAQDDRDKLVKALTEHKQIIADANEVLGRDKATRELLIRKAEVQAQIDETERRIVEATDRRQSALAEAWKDIVAGAVEPVRESLRGDLEAVEERDRSLRTIEDLETALQSSECDRCGQSLNAEAEDGIRAEIESLRDSLAGGSEKANARDAFIALSGIQRVGRLADAVAEDKEVGKLRRELVKQQQEIAELEEETKEGAEAELRQATADAEKANQAVGLLNEKLAAADEKIAEAKTLVKSADADVQKHSTSKESATLSAQADLAERLAELFEQVIVKFRDERREQVGEDASEIFNRLTTTPEFEGLRIDENYGLEILGPDGDPVTGRSAGQEQIVAFALIGALNRNATRTAPVVMDTPLGRLDRGHRTKVLEYLSDMAAQVFLLVHSAEVDESDLESIRDRIAAEYEMEKEATFRTNIEKRVIA